MSFLNALQAVEAEYESVVYAPEDTVKQLRDLFYSERISEEKGKKNKITRKKEKQASKQEIAAVVGYLESIDSQQYVARELSEMVERNQDLTYEATPARIRHLMNEHELPFRHVRRY